MTSKIRSYATLCSVDPSIGVDVTPALIEKLSESDRVACYLTRDIGEDRAGEFFVPQHERLLLNKPVFDAWRFTFLTRAQGIFSIDADVLLDRRNNVHGTLVALAESADDRYETIYKKLLGRSTALADAIDREAWELQAKIDALHVKRSNINLELMRLGARQADLLVEGYAHSCEIKEYRS